MNIEIVIHIYCLLYSRYTKKSTLRALLQKRGFLLNDQEKKSIENNRVLEDVYKDMGILCVEDLVDMVFISFMFS